MGMNTPKIDNTEHITDIVDSGKMAYVLECSCCQHEEIVMRDEWDGTPEEQIKGAIVKGNWTPYTIDSGVGGSSEHILVCEGCNKTFDPVKCALDRDAETLKWRNRNAPKVGESIADFRGDILTNTGTAAPSIQTAIEDAWNGEMIIVIEPEQTSITCSREYDPESKRPFLLTLAPYPIERAGDRQVYVPTERALGVRTGINVRRYHFPGYPIFPAQTGT